MLNFYKFYTLKKKLCVNIKIVATIYYSFAVTNFFSLIQILKCLTIKIIY